MRRPTLPSPTCLLAWGLAVVIPASLLALVALPWFGQMGRLGSAIEDSREQLARLRRLVATMPELRSELDKVNKNEAYKAFYFEAPTQALAGAELQRKIQDIVSAAHGRLISTQLLPEEKGERPPKVRIRTQIQGSADTLADVLYQLEQQRPFLFVDQLSVRSSARSEESPVQYARGRPLRRPPSIQGGELTVRIDVFGFALGEKK